MKHLIWKLVLPTTVITFSMYSKWWYVLPVDAPDTMMSGFPFIWIGEGWHTSMSLQIFVTEFILNLLVYFLFWSFIVFITDRFIFKMKVPKFLTILLYSITGVICLGALWIGTMPEQVYKTKRDFDIEVLATGYKFIWQQQDRPKYEEYKPTK